jgi:replicative DNA helicase
VQFAEGGSRIVTTPETPLPSNADAERMILGGMILDNGIAPQAIADLSPDDFLSFRNRHVFEAMRELLHGGDSAKAINPVTLKSQLEKGGHLDTIGGQAYIAHLFDGVPRFSDISDYIREVKEAAIKRKAIALGQWLMDSGFSRETTVDDLLSVLRAKTEELEESQSVDDLISSEQAVDRAMQNLEARWETGNAIAGLETGYRDLDQMLLGLRGGKYYCLAAGTGIGKTTLALNMAQRIVANDPTQVGLVISLEMGTDELTVRYLSTATQINSYSIETGKLTEQEKDFVREKAEELKRVKLEYVEGFSKVTAASLMSRVNKVRRKYKRINFLVVDYLQLLDSDGRQENENVRLSEISRTLKRIAQQFNIPVIVLSQLNREHMKRANRDYILSDLRGSGSIEQDSDVVMFLMPEDWTAPEDPRRRLVIAKHRGGKANQTCRLVFFGDQSRFENAATDSVYSPEPPAWHSEEPSTNGHHPKSTKETAGRKGSTRKMTKEEMDDYYNFTS